MKKFFLSSFALMAMMVAAIGFVSCGSDDDGDNSDSGSDSKASKAEIIYQAEMAPDMTKFLNVEIDYLDNGQKKTAKITDQNWSLKTTVASLPVKFGYKLRLSRNNVKLDESGNYILGIYVGKAYVAYNSKGKAISQMAYSSVKNFSAYNGEKETTKLTDEKLEKKIEFWNKMYAAAFELTAEGNLVEMGSDF